ncbi:hypothetical protein IQ269_24205 [Tychonema sp. LEGE 07199]|uniref:hypothetical protein n=1 Tax=unclassified Tychonema TaxID=2642144 RepID=UPI00187F2681|nr:MULTISPECIES: hypothetical protein [unclassified Tychonema]MBE9123816.1 hypothetical protein [Tychonema sp. LEGE 07199]MBE9135529.1 hypothetical protein [Tychonema sp. LEGE 07196]
MSAIGFDMQVFVNLRACVGEACAIALSYPDRESYFLSFSILRQAAQSADRDRASSVLKSATESIFALKKI